MTSTVSMLSRLWWTSCRGGDLGSGACQELRDEALTIFIAGHEATANALSGTWYPLATHSEAEARFHEEVDRVLEGRTPCAEDLGHLPYTRAVFDESLRLYPTTPAVRRKAATPTTVSGISLPQGALVLISIYNLHRHPDFWAYPEQFRPEWWLGGERLRSRLSAVWCRPARLRGPPFRVGRRAAALGAYRPPL